jgi:hypothetical protein
MGRQSGRSGFRVGLFSLKERLVEAVRVLRENVCHKSATTAERLPKLAAVSG